MSGEVSPLPEGRADGRERAVTMEGDFGIGSSRWPGLAKLAEESGELVQVLMKIVSMGGVENYSHWDGTDLLTRLVEELGDVRAAMIFLCEANGISKDAVHARADLKLKRFRHWHEAQRQAALAAPVVAVPEAGERECPNCQHWAHNGQCSLVMIDDSRCPCMAAPVVGEREEKP